MTGKQNLSDQHAAGDDYAIDQTIGWLLRYGMYLAAVVILAGAALFLAKHATDRPDYKSFQLLPLELRSPWRIVLSAAHGHSASIMQLGILLLIATPIARVVFSVVAFAIRRDKLYVLISGIVLVVLMYSLFVH
jgi:Predicted membrane protein